MAAVPPAREENGIAAEHDGEAAQLMGLLNHNKVATVGCRAWVEQSKRWQQRCIRVCKLRPERCQVRHAYRAPAECRERYQVGRPQPRQSRSHYLHSPGQLVPHRATWTVSRSPLIKRLNYLRVLSGVTPLRINQQQQGVADATDVSPRRAITHHDLGRKRSVGCPTGEEIELLLTQPSLRIQTSTCGVIALLAGEHEPSAADRLRWHVLISQRAVTERLAPIHPQAARAGILLTGQRQSVWPADSREVTAQRRRTFSEPSLPLLHLASISYQPHRGTTTVPVSRSECRGWSRNVSLGIRQITPIRPLSSRLRRPSVAVSSPS